MDENLRRAISNLDASVEELAQALLRLPPQLAAPSTWGPREMLVHIVVAHELYLGYLRAVAAGEAPPLFGRVHEQNALALEENQAAEVGELIDRLRGAQLDLTSLAVDRVRSASSFSFKVRSTRRTLEEAFVAIAAHIRGHLRQIKRIERQASVR